MQNGNSLVSIITTCFNSENTIERTINSVLDQTYKNIEYKQVEAKNSWNGTLIVKGNK